MDYTRATLQAAHRHSSNHRKELERSEICGCFCCCRTFTAAAVEEWVDEDGTAICPYCSVNWSSAPRRDILRASSNSCGQCIRYGLKTIRDHH